MTTRAFSMRTFSAKESFPAVIQSYRQGFFNLHLLPYTLTVIGQAFPPILEGFRASFKEDPRAFLEGLQAAEEDQFCGLCLPGCCMFSPLVFLLSPLLLHSLLLLLHFFTY